jgi:hypothetical protein
VDADSWEQFIEKCKDSRFVGRHRAHAYYYLTRFLAETKVLNRKTYERGTEDIRDIVISSFAQTTLDVAGHPWQLYCYNLGRLAFGLDAEPLARQAWEKSVTLCEAGEEAMKVMALLPLVALWQASMPFEGLADRTTSIIDGIRSSAFLNQDHFKNLLDAKDWQAALTMVANCPEKYFPFNYR